METRPLKCRLLTQRHVAEGQNAERQWRRILFGECFFPQPRRWPKGRTPKGNGDIIGMFMAEIKCRVAEGQNAERQWRLDSGKDQVIRLDRGRRAERRKAMETPEAVQASSP